MWFAFYYRHYICCYVSYWYLLNNTMGLKPFWSCIWKFLELRFLGKFLRFILIYPWLENFLSNRRCKNIQMRLDNHFYSIVKWIEFLILIFGESFDIHIRIYWSLHITDLGSHYFQFNVKLTLIRSKLFNYWTLITFSLFAHSHKYVY